MSGRIAAAALVLGLVLLGACAPKLPVTDDVTVEFAKDDKVVVTAQTTFDLAPDTEEARLRVDTARAAAVSATDDWSVRFARLSPEAERLTLEKDHGELERVTRAVRIQTRDLQQVFSDANITVHVLDGDGWKELTFYPGASSRATREQQSRFRSSLEAWSTAVARYYAVVHQTYLYMDRQPHRAEPLFDAILAVKTAEELEPLLTEDELALANELVAAMEDIAGRMDEEEGRAATLAEDVDAIFNPFPATITVEMPGDIVSSEGFAIRDKRAMIDRISLMDAITKLEGRWISPDPLAALMRDQSQTAAELARMPRRSEEGVHANIVAGALRAELERPKTYVVRWREH